METQLPIKYFINNKLFIQYVSFSLLKNDGSVLSDHPDSACFAIISTRTIHKDTAKIFIYHPKEYMGYGTESIERWIKDINEFGFPCSYIGSNNINHNFQINLSDFKYKCHLLTTLMLLRVLWEPIANKIPEIYFQMIDKNPNGDKFDYIQTAHKSLPTGYDSKTGHYHPTPTGHMATYSGNGKNVSKETLFKRYEESKIEVFHIHQPYDYKNPKGYTSITQNDKWNGDY